MHEPGENARRGRGAGAPSTAVVAGLATMAAVLGLAAPGAMADSTRKIALYNIHTKTTLEVTFKRDGEFVPEALQKINWHLRDWRRNEATKMDPDLIDLVWEIHREVGSSQPIHVISGFRSPRTNAMLQKAGGGVAKRSLHMQGKAIDIRVPDLKTAALYQAALDLRGGGVGLYRKSGFIHLDVGRVRTWGG